jgi:hypothetical protein
MQSCNCALLYKTYSLFSLQRTEKDVRNDCWCKWYSSVAQRIVQGTKKFVTKLQKPNSSFPVTSKRQEQQVAKNGVTEGEIMLSISCGA